MTPSVPEPACGCGGCEARSAEPSRFFQSSRSRAQKGAEIALVRKVVAGGCRVARAHMDCDRVGQTRKRVLVGPVVANDKGQRSAVLDRARGSTAPRSPCSSRAGAGSRSSSCPRSPPGRRDRPEQASARSSRSGRALSGLRGGNGASCSVLWARAGRRESAREVRSNGCSGPRWPRGRSQPRDVQTEAIHSRSPARGFRYRLDREAPRDS